MSNNNAADDNRKQMLHPLSTNTTRDEIGEEEASKEGEGMSKQKEEMQGNLERYRTIMDSMTENEKNNPQILKSDRIRRVARGSGVTEKNVRELIAQWNKSRKMMKGIQGNRKMSKQMRKMMKSGEFENLTM